MKTRYAMKKTKKKPVKKPEKTIEKPPQNFTVQVIPSRQKSYRIERALGKYKDICSWVVNLRFSMRFHYDLRS
jgi:hypothetical protein